ncbi:sulfatase-like hydrolase/transferase [Carboxylicivirga sp. RSCT41]|uniref:sulfatase-like hydrolase/transferase n=1 Tax=Carboxylicivirga agarovorans TaxID=3417570 RepID=UPI003D34D0DB
MDKSLKALHLVVFFLMYSISVPAVKKSEERPNILIIVSDDQGYGDFGFTGNKLVKTPNLDRLSEEGAFYPHLLVGPACTPTRSALFTGRSYLDAGVWGVGSRGQVRRDETMMPKFFSPSGYHTWAFGKMDGGLSMMEITPADRGFDVSSYTGGGGKCTSPVPGYCHLTKKGWVAELVTDAAIKKIEAADDKPWLMVMAYIIPHLPWLCPDDYANPYRQEGYSEDIAQLYGSIHQMDDQIGRLLAALDKTGQADNTIVLFLSDNGPVDAVNNKEVGVWENYEYKNEHTKDWDMRNVCDLVGRKGEVWDNGIRSPLLVRWPKRIKPGIRKQAIGVEDILPTLMDLAEIPDNTHPEHLPLAGKTFRASLEDKGYADERDIFRLATGGPGTPGSVDGIVPDATKLDYSMLHTILRSGKYKYHNLPGGEQRLYDMEKDPGEKYDLSGKYPERTSQMAVRCQAQWEEIAKRQRTFPMRQLVINNASHSRKSWKFPVTHVLEFEGQMKTRDFGGGVTGFQSPGDKAEYTIEVQKSLKVSVVAIGKRFDQCAPINLMIDGKVLEVKSREADKIVFGAVNLQAGNIPVSFFVDRNAKKGVDMGEILSVTLNVER